jgi:hypothetical protein
VLLINVTGGRAYLRRWYGLSASLSGVVLWTFTRGAVVLFFPENQASAQFLLALSEATIWVPWMAVTFFALRLIKAVHLERHESAAKENTGG